MTNEAAADMIGVTRRYGDVVALDNVSFRIGRGEVVALLGPNGAGKTTLVRLLLGLIRPDSGTVRLWDGPPQSLAARRRVGAMLQVAKVPEVLTVREHLHLFASYYETPRPLDEVIEAAGVRDIAHRRFGTLSGGQRQRALFALALCGDPDLLVLDEPTVGLDVDARYDFWDQVRGLVARGRTLLVTTHYLDEAEAIASRLVVIHGGRIRGDGTRATLTASTGTTNLQDAYFALTGRTRHVAHARA
jgi:ABC-2 type transport system ATP-binding protein